MPSRQNSVLGNIRRELHEAGLIQRPRELFEAAGAVPAENIQWEKRMNNKRAHYEAQRDAEWMEYLDDKLAHYEGTKMQKELA